MQRPAPCSPHAVLIVDDDPGIRCLLSELLSDEGYAVETATNGCEALSLLRRVRPCLILLDIMMPVLDGWGFCREQQRRPDVADIPVALMSAGDTLVRPQPPCRPVALFPKPFDLDQLVDRLRHVVA